MVAVLLGFELGLLICLPIMCNLARWCITICWCKLPNLWCPCGWHPSSFDLHGNVCFDFASLIIVMILLVATWLMICHVPWVSLLPCIICANCASDTFCCDETFKGFVLDSPDLFWHVSRLLEHVAHIFACSPWIMKDVLAYLFIVRDYVELFVQLCFAMFCRVQKEFSSELPYIVTIVFVVVNLLLGSTAQLSRNLFHLGVIYTSSHVFGIGSAILLAAPPSPAFNGASHIAHLTRLLVIDDADYTLCPHRPCHGSKYVGLIIAWRCYNKMTDGGLRSHPTLIWSGTCCFVLFWYFFEHSLFIA